MCVVRCDVVVVRVLSFVVYSWLYVFVVRFVMFVGRCLLVVGCCMVFAFVVCYGCVVRCVLSVGC